ncbi:MAG: c-type cytochrome [Alphaproteobacteria bacterium]
MSMIKFQKLVGAVIFALLIFTAINVGFDEFLDREPLEETVYPVPGGEESEAAAVEQPAVETAGGAEAAVGEASTTEQAPATEAAAPSPLSLLLAAADPENGRKIARKCAVCHDLSPAARKKVGPGLWGIVGAPRAAHEGFKYSAAFSALDGTWSYQELDAFLAKPKAYVPGTKMAFAGLKSPEDRADLIAFLRTLSDNPTPLPGE